MAYHVTVVPPTSTTWIPSLSSNGEVSIGGDASRLALFINQVVGGGTLIQILETGPRLVLIWSA